METDNAGSMTWRSAYYATSILTFGAIAANSTVTMTMTATGAVIGDMVALGIDNAAVPVCISYFAWVSASNTISIRATNPTGTLQNAAAGNFHTKVIKW